VEYLHSRVFQTPPSEYIRRVNDAKDGVGAHKVSRETWIAIFIARQASGVYRRSPAIRGAGNDAVEESLIVFNSFFVLCPGADWRRASRAGAGGNTVTSRVRAG